MCELKKWAHPRTPDEKAIQEERQKAARAKYRADHREKRKIEKREHYQRHRESMIVKQKTRNYGKMCECTKCKIVKPHRQFRFVDKNETDQRDTICRECRRAEEQPISQEHVNLILERRAERRAATEQRRVQRKLDKEAKRLAEGESYKEEQRKRSAFFLAHRDEIMAAAEAYRVQYKTSPKSKERLVDVVRRLQTELREA